MCLYDYLNTKSVDTHSPISNRLRSQILLSCTRRVRNHKLLNLYRLNSLSYSELLGILSCLKYWRSEVYIRKDLTLNARFYFSNAEILIHISCCIKTHKWLFVMFRCFTTLLIAQKIQRRKKISVNNELERRWKETVVSLFGVL